MSRARPALLVAAVAGSLVAAPALASAAPAPPPPCPRIVSIADHRANEGTAPIGVPTFFTFTITSTGCARAGGVGYESSRPAGTSPGDITPVEGTLWFPAGDMTPRTIVVLVTADSTAEPDERFVVRICAATPNVVQIDRSTALGTIINDDLGTPGDPSGWERGFRCSE